HRTARCPLSRLRGCVLLNRAGGLPSADEKRRQAHGWGGTPTDLPLDVGSARSHPWALEFLLGFKWARIAAVWRAPNCRRMRSTAICAKRSLPLIRPNELPHIPNDVARRGA